MRVFQSLSLNRNLKGLLNHRTGSTTAVLCTLSLGKCISFSVVRPYGMILSSLSFMC